MHQAVTLMIFVAIICQAKAQSAQEIFRATGQSQGFCVRIGTTDGMLESDLANNGAFVVYGIASSDDNRDAARKYFATRGLQGIVTVEKHASMAALPFSDDLANLVIADLSSGVTEQEVMRIVAPKGAAYLRKDGSWKAVLKSQPGARGDFSMFEANAECNLQSTDSDMKPSNSLRWIADYPDRDNGYGLEHGTGCRIWHDKLVGVEGSQENREGSLWLKCRNAYNGRLLWRRKTLSKGSSDYDPRGRALCLGNNKLFTYVADEQPLAALDLETGATVKTYEGGPLLNRSACALEYGIVLYHNGKVIQAYDKTLCVHDELTGNLLWKKTAGPYPYACVSGSNVYAISGTYESGPNTRQQNHGASNRYCYDLNNGTQKWSAVTSGTSLAGLHFYGGKLVEFQGVYKCCGSTNGHVAVIDPSNGQQIWKQNYPEMASIGTCLFLGDRVFVTSSNYRNSVSYDLSSGAVRTEPNASGVHGACKRNVGTSEYLLVNGMYFVGKDQAVSKTSLSRGGCGASVHPANGMVYAPPSGCTCYKMYHGYAAFANENSNSPIPENVRLETHAAAPAKMPADAVWPAIDEWPMFMANIRRGSYTPTSLKGNITRKWSVKITGGGNGSMAWDDFTHNNSYSGILTPPTVSGGRVFVSVTHTHEIVALNANNGKEIWRFTAGGRVDGPPTIYGDLCIFGCRDGWAYCLNAATGELVWRFFAGRTLRKIMAYGQVESPWAHAGSAMVYRGHVYIVAGRFSETDSGFIASKLDAYTGKQIWSDVVTKARAQNGGVRGGTPVNSMLRPIIFDGRVMMMDYIAVHPELNKVASVTHYLDVHNPPDQYWAQFPDVTLEQWNYKEWQIGRYHKSKFNIINLGNARGAGMSYGWGRYVYGSTFACFSDNHMTVKKDKAFVQVPLDSVGNLTLKANEIPANQPVVYTPESGESIRGTAEAGNNFLVLHQKSGTINKLRIVTIGSTTNTDFDLPGEPVWHGLAVAGGEAFVTTDDGSVTCLGSGVAGIANDPEMLARILNIRLNPDGFSIVVDRTTNLAATIYDLKGTIVLQRDARTNSLTLELAGLSQGYFLLKLQVGKNRLTKRILITR